MSLVSDARRFGSNLAWGATLCLLALAPLTASSQPLAMKVTGSSTVMFQDVLVGEVWLCSGQSNMQWKVSKSKCSKLAAELSAETEGKVAPIREFEVTSVTSQFERSWEVVLALKALQAASMARFSPTLVLAGGWSPVCGVPEGDRWLWSRAGWRSGLSWARRTGSWCSGWPTPGVGCTAGNDGRHGCAAIRRPGAA